MMQKKGIIVLDLILVSFVVLVISLAFNSVMAQNQTPIISVSPESIEVSPGDTFTLEIKVEPKGSEIYGVEYNLSFDNSLLKAQTQTQGTFLSQDGMNTIEIANEINNTFGKLEYCEFRDVESSVTNPGVLTSISFEVIGTAGTSDLNLGKVILTNSDFEMITETEINNGECIIGEVTGEQLTPTPTVTPSPAVSPELTPAASPTSTSQAPVTTTPTPTPTSQAPETTPKPEEKSETPGFEAPLAIAVIALIAIWFVRKRM